MRSLQMTALAVGLMLAPTSACSRDSGSCMPLESAEESGAFAQQGLSFGCVTIIPDAQDEGITIGPIRLPDDGRIIRNVVLGLDIRHPHIGDLQLELGYDADGDGSCDATTEVELHLARGDAQIAQALFACPVGLDGVCYFRDDALDDLKSDADLLPREFTGTSPSDGIRAFMVFQGFRSGGCFYLTARDTLAEDVGIIRDWMIWADSSAPAPGEMVAVN